MSARSRKLRNQPSLNVVSRRDRTIAIGGSLGIVAVSTVLIWAMRPGNFRPGTGGIIYRQPRAAWLVLFFAVGIAFSWWYAKRADSKFNNKTRAVVLLSSGVLSVAIAVVVFWDVKWDGIVRTYTPPPTFPTTPTPTPTTTIPGATTTTALGATTTTPGGATTTAAPTTTVPTTTSGAPTTTVATTTVAPTTTIG